MQTLIKPSHQPVRTVLHLSPAVTSAALVQAQRHRQGLGEWVEGLVVQTCASDETTQSERRLAELMSIELFAHVASNCPGALQGRWRLLFDRCMQDEALWRYPEVSLEEAEAGADCQPVLDIGELSRRWPHLVASVWLVA